MSPDDPPAGDDVTEAPRFDPALAGFILLAKFLGTPAEASQIILPDAVAVDPDSAGDGQSKRSPPVADGDVAPAHGVEPGAVHERLLALMTQDMATFGAQGAGEGQFGWRERELPARFDFFAT